MVCLEKKIVIVVVLLSFTACSGCSLIYTPKRTKRPSVEKSVTSKKKVVAKKKRRKKRKKSQLVWPVKGTITSRFGKRGTKQHEGVDIGAPLGTKIRAAAGGKVVFSGWGPTGYGKMIVIKHSPNYASLYAHNSKNLVRVGQKVKKGSVIGAVGETGRASGPHLHFEIRRKLKPTDPLKYLPSRK